MMTWLKNLLTGIKKPEEIEVVPDSDDLMFWGIIEGPIEADDIPDSGFPSEAVCMILKASENGEVFDVEVWFESFDDAYTIVRHFDQTIEPIKLNKGRGNPYASNA
jgi:hypothetical protein